MPDPEDRGAATVRFLRSPPHEGSSASWVDARHGLGDSTSAPGQISLAPILRENASRWREAFIEWLGGLNRRNAGLLWWAHTSTAKNLLSSPLGDSCFSALALVALARSHVGRELYIVGADAARAESIIRALVDHQPQRKWRLLGPALAALVRLWWQFLRMLALWASGQLRLYGAEPKPNVILITYLDRNFKAGADPFFGSLAQLLVAREPQLTVAHFAFLHAPYRELRKRMQDTQPPYHALFDALGAADIVWAFRRSLSAWRAVFRQDAPALEGIPTEALLRQALFWDLGRGGYLLNLLVYRAAKKLFANCRPTWVIYPYENKSLEKMLLLGARASGADPTMVGFQHTSITRRHTTLLFAEGEAERTPLPNRIVTAGEVALRYLSTEGRYPPGLLVVGCSLRQAWRGPLPRRSPGTTVRLLLALSSSRKELQEAVSFLKNQASHHWEVGVRPHPEFPVSLLPSELAGWVKGHATDFSRTPLADNLEWCDVALYVSSTVGLEALMVGRPAINLRLSDSIDPDPLLEPVALAWKADTPPRLADVLEDIRRLTDDEFRARQEATVLAMAGYFRPVTPQSLSAFFP